MFAWRKPKPSDDEPLVPHGLVWQATEEPMPAKAERIDPGSPREASSPFPVPKTRIDPPNEHYRDDDGAPPKMGAASDPLPWASMNAKDAVKRPPPFWDSNASLKALPAKPSPDACDSNSTDSFRAIPTLSVVPAINAETADRSATARVALKRFLADRAEELHATWSELTHVIAELFANTRHKFADWQLRENIRRTREQAQVRLAQSIANVSHQAPKAGAAADEQKTSKMQDRLRVARNTALLIQNKAAAALAGSKQSARGLMNRRIRIRIAAASQLRTYVGRFQDAQTRSRNILQRNSRLVTSLAMAALSALFTLGLIIIVGHYQPSANADVPGIAPTRQSAATIPTTPVVAKPSPTRTANSAAATKAVPVVNTALRTQEKVVPVKTKTVRRPHHNEDEDYVAPDTYVYYGKKR